MKRKRLLSCAPCLLGFSFGAIMGVSVAFEGGGRGAPKMAKLWTGMVCYPVVLLDKSVGPIPGVWPFVIVAGIAAFVPGMFCVFVIHFLQSVASQRSSDDHVPPERRNVGILLVMCLGACTSPSLAQCNPGDPPLPPPPPGGGGLLYSLRGDRDRLGFLMIRSLVSIEQKLDPADPVTFTQAIDDLAERADRWLAEREKTRQSRGDK